MYISLYHCVSLWKCKKKTNATLTSSFSFTLSFFLSDNLSVCGLASLARRKPRFPRGRTSLRFLKGTITVHEFLPKRRFRKTRNAIVIIFLRWQLTRFLELQLSPHSAALAFARTSSVTVSFALRAERPLTTTSLWSYLTIRVRLGAF